MLIMYHRQSILLEIEWYFCWIRSSWNCHFFLAIKGTRFQRKHAKLSEYPLDEQVKILDTLGDLYCQAKAYNKALGCYKKEVQSTLY